MINLESRGNRVKGGEINTAAFRCKKLNLNLKEGDRKMKRIIRFSSIIAVLAAVALVFTQPARAIPNLKQQILTNHFSASSDKFGFDVSTSKDGKIAVVGDPGYKNSKGIVLVYNFNGSKWTFDQELYIKNGCGGVPVDEFGFSCRISSNGKYIAVGVPNAAANAGAVYVFERINPSPLIDYWDLKKKIPSPKSGLRFGLSVDVSDNGVVVVGAPCAGKDWNGAAYVETWNGTKYVGTPITSPAPVGSTVGIFGSAVAISPDGSTIVIGEEGGLNPQPQYGAVHIFKYTSSKWSAQKTISSPGIINGRFGKKVDISGNDLIVVGAPGVLGGLVGDAYAYKLKNGNWKEIQLDHGLGNVKNGFGRGVSASSKSVNGTDDIAIVGLPTGSAPMKGAAYIFESGPAGTLSKANKLNAKDGINDDLFGYSVAASGNGKVFVSGAYGNSPKGKAYILAEPAGTPPPPPYIPTTPELKFWFFENLQAFVCPLLFNPWDPEPIPYHTAGIMEERIEEIHYLLEEIEEPEIRGSLEQELEMVEIGRELIWLQEVGEEDGARELRHHSRMTLLFMAIDRCQGSMEACESDEEFHQISLMMEYFHLELAAVEAEFFGYEGWLEEVHREQSRLLEEMSVRQEIDQKRRI
jgi:FG-GAP repeat